MKRCRSALRAGRPAFVLLGLIALGVGRIAGLQAQVAGVVGADAACAWRADGGLGVMEVGKLPGGMGAAGPLISPPLPGNPAYLFRILYIIPTDRLLDYTESAGCPGGDCPEYTAKVDSAVRSIQTAYETISDVIERDINIFALPIDPTAPGRKMNLEREDGGTGGVKVWVIHGRLPTKAAAPAPSYWGGLELGYGGNFLGNVANDVFAGTTQYAEAQHTCYVLIPDIIEWDNCVDPPTCGTIGNKGYVGLGSNSNYESSGWGGVGTHSAGALLVPPAVNPADPVSRAVAWNGALCRTDTAITRPNPYTNEPETWQLACTANGQLDYGTTLSTQIGPLAHETCHTFGLGHGGLSPEPYYIDFMGGSHHFFGRTIAKMYGLNCACAYPYGVGSAHPFPNHVVGQYESSLGAVYSIYAAFSPYFNPAVNPDKTDPLSDTAWPPNGYAWDSTAPLFTPTPKLDVRVRAFEIAGTATPQAGMNMCMFGYGAPKAFAQFATDGIAAPETLRFSTSATGLPRGQVAFGLDVCDRAGNFHGEPLYTFRMVKDSQTTDGAVFVRPVGSPVNGSATLGSWNNAYQDIQAALDARGDAGSGTVFVTNGTYAITAPINPRPYVNLIGESAGGVILDGGGDAGLDLIYANGVPTSRFIGSMIANLVFRNARRGIANFQDTYDATCYFASICGCTFYNLSGAAIDLRNLDLTVNVTGNTVVDCQSGILLGKYPLGGINILKDAGFRLNFKNNLVVNRAGTGTTGIQLQDVELFHDDGIFIGWKGRTGWNDSVGFAANFTGNSYPAGGLEGDLSAAPTFVAGEGPVFELAEGSAGANAADPLNENADGSRRHMGAFLIMSGATPTPTATGTATPAPTSPPCPAVTVTEPPQATPSPMATASPSATPCGGRSVGDFDCSGCTGLEDFLFLLDNWQLDFQGEAVGLNDFLALLDYWETGAGCA